MDCIFDGVCRIQFWQRLLLVKVNLLPHVANAGQLPVSTWRTFTMLEMEEAQLRKAAAGSEHKEAEVSTVPYWFSWSVGST